MTELLAFDPKHSEVSYHTPDFNNSKAKLVAGDSVLPLMGPNRYVLKGYDR